MREELQQLNHLAEVLYNESKDLYTVSKGKAQIDEMQENIDNIINELLKAERET